MNPLFRSVAYLLAVVTLVAAAGLPLIGVVTEGGRFVQFASLIGVALIAAGLFLGSLEEDD